MFRGMSLGEFEAGGKKAYLFIDNDMQVPGLQAILNQVMHYTVEIQKAAENEEAQRLKDEEAAKKPELEAEPAPAAEVEVKEEQPVEA